MPKKQMQSIMLKQQTMQKNVSNQQQIIQIKPQQQIIMKDEKTEVVQPQEEMKCEEDVQLKSQFVDPEKEKNDLIHEIIQLDLKIYG